MTTDESFLNPQHAATTVGAKFKAPGAFIVLGLVLMALLPVSCRGDSKAASPAVLLVEVTGAGGKTLARGEIAGGEAADLGDIEFLAAGKPSDDVAVARVELEMGKDSVPEPGATVTITVRGPDPGAKGQSFHSNWPEAPSLFIVINKDHFFELFWSVETEAGGQNEDGPVAGAGDGLSGEALKDAAPGDIVFEILDAKKQPVVGAFVKMLLPGADGSLEKSPNLAFEATDGAAADADGSANGMIVFRKKEFQEYVKNGNDFLVSVTAESFSPTEKNLSRYSGNVVNVVKVSMVKVSKVK